MKTKREIHIQKLKNEEFDVLVVGGGATGCGIALDAASRGLKTALIEAKDFSSGTSSKSTKLIHGGVRYLKKAVTKFDLEQYQLVKEGLQERRILKKIAPHLVQELSLLVPVYSWIEAAYYYFGLKFYDIVAGFQNMQSSNWVSSKKTLSKISFLNSNNLKGTIEYFDGQFDDARMNVTLAITAEELGATIANHVLLTGFLKKNGQISKAMLRDDLTNDSWLINSKSIINATGPYTDKVRYLDDPNAPPLLQLSSGIHILLSKRLPLQESGLVIPTTSDDRVMFLLPWEGGTLVGTTDIAEDNSNNLQPSREEEQYLLDNIAKYISVPVSKSDIMASWKGMRPLIKKLEVLKTACLKRDHMIEKSSSGLYTIVGGKWTSYRKMAEEMVNQLASTPSRTQNLLLVGAKGYSTELANSLVKKYQVDHDIAAHIARAYGDRADHVLAPSSSRNRISQKYPYIYSEITHAIRNEFACTAMDVLARRLRLAFLDSEESLQVLPEVVKTMGQELGWDKMRMQEEMELSSRCIHSHFK